MQALITKIRRRETPLYDWIYRAARAVRRFSFPTIRPLHLALFYERTFRLACWRRFWKAVYYQPIFRARCASVGSGLEIIAGGGDGMPAVSGALELHLGDDVQLTERITFAGARIQSRPTLRIGDGTYVGFGVAFSVAKEVTIGRHCKVAATLVADNPGHPILNSAARLRNEAPGVSEVRPVNIGDYVWLGTGCYVCPGVTIGDGAIVSPGSVVSGMEIPPFTLVAGNPGRIRAKLPLPASLREIVGDERYESYKAAHRQLKV